MCGGTKNKKGGTKRGRRREQKKDSHGIGVGNYDRNHCRKGDRKKITHNLSSTAYREEDDGEISLILTRRYCFMRNGEKMKKQIKT